MSCINTANRAHSDCHDHLLMQEIFDEITREYMGFILSITRERFEFYINCSNDTVDALRRDSSI